MRILIVRTFPNVINIEHYNVQEIGLARALVRAGHECGIVFYNGLKKSRVEEVAVSGTDRKIRIYWLRGLNLIKNGIFFGLSDITKQYDVVQVHEYDQLTSWWYYSFGKKPLVIYHGPYDCEFNKGYNLKCKIFDHTFLKLCRNKNVMCLAKSPLAAEFLIRRGFQNVHTVGVGLDTTVYEKPVTLSNGTEGSILSAGNAHGESTRLKKKINLLYVGKIEERRNVDFIEKVMRSLEEYPEITLTLVGNGEPKYVHEYLKKIDDMLQRGKIRYIASVKQKDMGQVYREHDMLLFPTNYDIYGMVLLEAMYCGMVCLSSRNGGAVSVIKNRVNGVILNEFIVQQWKDAIVELATDGEKLAQMKVAGRKTISEGFTWDAVAEKFVKYYKITTGESAEKQNIEL